MYLFYFRLPKKDSSTSLGMTGRVLGMTGRVLGMTGEVARNDRESARNDRSGLEDLTVDDRASQSKLIGIFKIITESQSSCQSGYLHTKA